MFWAQTQTLRSICAKRGQFRSLLSRQLAGGTSFWRLSRLACSPLIHLGECADVKLKGLVILAFYLQFGLQLLHQNFQPRNLYPQFLNARSGACATMASAGGYRWRLRSSCVARLTECPDSAAG